MSFKAVEIPSLETPITSNISLASRRVQQFAMMQVPPIKTEMETCSLSETVVRDGDRDWQRHISSGNPFVPVKEELKGNPNAIPKVSEMPGNTPIPTTRLRITGTATLERMTEERLLTRTTNKKNNNTEDTGDRILGELEVAAQMSGYGIHEYIPSGIGSCIISLESDSMNSKSDSSNSITIDVKPMKRITVQDEQVQDDFAWIEIVDVVGNVGWYKWTKVDYFAFEQSDQFVLIAAPILKEYVETFVKMRPVTYTPKEAVLTAYMKTTNQRKDVWTLVSIKTLLDFAKSKSREGWMVWAKVDVSGFD